MGKRLSLERLSSLDADGIKDIIAGTGNGYPQGDGPQAQSGCACSLDRRASEGTDLEGQCVPVGQGPDVQTGSSVFTVV